METLNYALIDRAITNALANTPHNTAISGKTSFGCIATNTRHIEILFSDEDAENALDILENITEAIKTALIQAVQKRGFIAHVTSIYNTSDNFLIKVMDKDDELYAIIHLSCWDAEYAITTTQYYL